MLKLLRSCVTVKMLLNMDNSGYQDRNALNPFPNKPWFLCVCSKSLWKTMWEKEKFLLFSHCFLPVEELFAFFLKLALLVWKSLKFVVWERVNNG